jgi:hypothetical protein
MKRELFGLAFRALRFYEKEMDATTEPRFARSSPSPRYRSLVALYRDMHEFGEREANRPAEKTYAGLSCLPQASYVRELIRLTQARSLLDYGSGKGRQYDPREIRDEDGTTYPDLRTYWGVEAITCYDPAYPRFSTLPQGPFDGVICTDVLEHCPEEDLPWILDEIFSFARLFVFANVACYPAGKRLPTGENAHCTVRGVEWWQALIRETANRHRGVLYRFHFELRDPPPPPRSLKERLLRLFRKPKPAQRIVEFASD